MLLREFDLDQPALHRLAAVVLDIDLKDGKFAEPEVAGIDHLIAGIAWSQADDDARLSQGAVVFDALHEFFRRRSKQR